MERPCEDTLETALLCKYAYVLLAWKPKPASTSDTDKPWMKDADQWKMLRRRVQLAEANQWHVLVDELLAKVRSYEVERLENSLMNSREQSEEERDWRRRSSAIDKVKHDCSRFAAQLLRGQTLLPACEATARAQRAQLALERPEEQRADLQAALDEAFLAGSKVALKIKDRDVRRRLSALRIGAARLLAMTCYV